MLIPRQIAALGWTRRGVLCPLLRCFAVLRWGGDEIPPVQVWLPSRPVWFDRPVVFFRGFKRQVLSYGDACETQKSRGGGGEGDDDDDDDEREWGRVGDGIGSAVYIEWHVMRGALAPLADAVLRFARFTVLFPFAFFFFSPTLNDRQTVATVLLRPGQVAPFQESPHLRLSPLDWSDSSLLSLSLCYVCSAGQSFWAGLVGANSDSMFPEWRRSLMWSARRAARGMDSSSLFAALAILFSFREREALCHHWVKLVARSSPDFFELNLSMLTGRGLFFFSVIKRENRDWRWRCLPQVFFYSSVLRESITPVSEWFSTQAVFSCWNVRGYMRPEMDVEDDLDGFHG